MSERVAGLLFKIRADTTALRQGMKQAQGAINGLLKSINTLGGAMGVAFGGYTLKRIGETVLSMIELGDKVGDVRDAFDRLNQPDLLDKLRKATFGMLNDFELMKLTIRAANFNIPLKNLATYFEFATRRAEDTGESIESLVSQIVEGVGKQAMRTLKSAGIATDDWSKIFKQTGDFAETALVLMNNELKDAGEFTKSAGDELVSLREAWKNLKDSIAEETNQKSIANALGGIADVLNVLADNKLWEAIIGGFVKFYEHAMYAAGGVLTAYAKIKDLINGKETKGYTKTERKEFGIPKPSFGWVPSAGLMDLPDKIEKPEKTDHIANLSGWDQFLDTEGYEQAVKRIEESTKHLTEIFQGVGKEMFDITNEVKDGMMSIFQAFASGLEGIFSGDLGVGDLFKGVLQSFGRFLQQMGAAIILYGKAWQAIRLAPLRPELALAAGLALITIGAMISGLAQRGSSGMGGGGGAGASSVMGTKYGTSFSIQTESIVKGNDIYQVSKRYQNFRNATT